MLQDFFWTQQRFNICHFSHFQKYLEEQEEEEDDEMKTLGQGFYLHYKICDKLYSHQKEGVLWLWNLFNKKKGGILADDMG